MFGYLNQIKVVDRIDHFAKPFTEKDIERLYDSEHSELLLEAVTLEDLENTLLFSLDPVPHMMLEAFKAKASQLNMRVKKFANQLGRSLGELSIAGEPEIGKPRKSGAVAVQMAKIPLSDGQSISIAFHAPDNDPLKINADDTLIAFRFLLNSRDITHTVAPKGNQDLSLKEAVTKLSSLAVANSSKFVAAQEQKTADRQALEQAQEKTVELSEQAAALVDETESLEVEFDKQEKKAKRLQGQIDTQNEIQEELRKQLAELQASVKHSGAASSVDKKHAFTDWSKYSESEQLIIKEYDRLNAVADQASADLNDLARPHKASNGLVSDEFRQSAEYKQATNNWNQADAAAKAWHKANKNLLGKVSKERYQAKYRPAQSQSTSNNVTVNGVSVETRPLTDVKTDSMLNPTIKAAATKGDDAIWYRQGELNPLNAPVGSIAARSAFKKAGFNEVRYKHSRLQGIYILEDSQGHVVTKSGYTAVIDTIVAENLEPESQAEPQANGESVKETESNLFWYGLRARPYGMGTTPNDATEQKVINSEDALIQFPNAGDNIRHGAIGYAEKLTEKQVSDFELVDLSGVGEFKFDEDFAQMIVRQALTDWADDKEVSSIARADFVNLKQVVELGSFKKVFSKLLTKQPEYVDRKTDVAEYKEWNQTVEAITAKFFTQIAEEMGIIADDIITADDADEAEKGKTAEEQALLNLNPSEFEHGAIRKEKGYSSEKEITSDIRNFIARLKKAGKLPKGVKISVSKGKGSTITSINLKLTDLPDSIKLYCDKFLQHTIDNPRGGYFGGSRYTEEVSNLIAYVTAYADQYDKVRLDPYADYGNDHAVYGTDLEVHYALSSERLKLELESFTEIHAHGVESEVESESSIRASLNAEDRGYVEYLESHSDFKVKRGKQTITLINGAQEDLNMILKGGELTTQNLKSAYVKVEKRLNSFAYSWLTALVDRESVDEYKNPVTGDIGTIKSTELSFPKVSKDFATLAPQYVNIEHGSSVVRSYVVADNGKLAYALTSDGKTYSTFDNFNEAVNLIVKEFSLINISDEDLQSEQGEEMEHISKLESIRDYQGDATQQVIDEFQTQLEQAYAYFESVDQVAENEPLMEAAMLAITALIESL